MPSEHTQAKEDECRLVGWGRLFITPAITHADKQNDTALPTRCRMHACVRCMHARLIPQQQCACKLTKT